MEVKTRSRIIRSVRTGIWLVARRNEKKDKRAALAAILSGKSRPIVFPSDEQGYYSERDTESQGGKSHKYL